MAQLKVGEHYFNNGDEVEFYLLNDYRMNGKMITLKDIPTTMRKDKGTLKYKKGWMTSRWVIINGGQTTYEIELNNYNVLNTNPFSSNKNNILLLDSDSLKAQPPDIGSMEKITTEGEEFLDGEILTFTQSWNNYRVETRGILRKMKDKWVIEYMDGFTPKIEKLENGLKYVKLKKIPTRPEPTPPPPPVLDVPDVASVAGFLPPLPPPPKDGPQV
jgi:hypothetical protein